MTQIFAYTAVFDNKPILFAGTDSEGSPAKSQEKLNTFQKLYVIGDYFLMGTGIHQLVHETVSQLLGLDQGPRSLDELADKILEIGQEFRDVDKRTKEDKPALLDCPEYATDLIICGKGPKGDGFDITKIDLNGYGFSRACQEKPGPYKEKRTWIGIDGNGYLRTGQMLDAMTSGSLGEYLKMPLTDTQEGIYLMLYSFLRDVGASVPGVNNSLQFGFMTLDHGITTLYPGEINFADKKEFDVSTTRSRMIRAYLHNLFGEDVSSANAWKLKAQADRIHSDYSEVLQRFKKVSTEAKEAGEKVGRYYHRMTRSQRSVNMRDIIIPTARCASETEKEVVDFTRALIKRGKALKPYRR
ncbi:hypothetical protein GF351_00555 [Candidatus Woesearchaeota archaeon]|nr:hypothetical protein [Candidatus Woesearchaeota archaeon]